MMNATAQATARRSLQATGFPPPIGATVPWQVRALGRVLGRSWREDREASIIRAMDHLRGLDTRAPLETEVNRFVVVEWEPTQSVRADQIVVGDVMERDGLLVFVAGVVEAWDWVGLLCPDLGLLVLAREDRVRVLHKVECG
jgi:hypothetical protein